MIVGYTPREYHVVKAQVGRVRRFFVLAQDLQDPDVWALLNSCDSKQDAVEYVLEVQARARQMAEAI